MKITMCICFLLLLLPLGFTQKNIYKLRIKHADPQLIYLLLKGKTNFSTFPEMSTLGNGGFGSSSLGGGFNGNRLGG